MCHPSLRFPASDVEKHHPESVNSNGVEAILLPPLISLLSLLISVGLSQPCSSSAAVTLTALWAGVAEIARLAFILSLQIPGPVQIRGRAEAVGREGWAVEATESQHG